MMVEEILDHWISEEAIEKWQWTYINATGNTGKRQTTSGWKILVQ